jgi:hypothetical protein
MATPRQTIAPPGSTRSRSSGSGPGILAARREIDGVALTIGIVVITVVNLGIQFRINAWHRMMFDAIEHKDGGAIVRSRCSSCR